MGSPDGYLHTIVRGTDHKWKSIDIPTAVRMNEDIDRYDRPYSEENRARVREDSQVEPRRYEDDAEEFVRTEFNR